MERWTGAQIDRLNEPARNLVIEHKPLAISKPNDPWEAAILQAQGEIRVLIETGDLSHEEITTGWIEAWAADIYRARREPACL